MTHKRVTLDRVLESFQGRTGWAPYRTAERRNRLLAFRPYLEGLHATLPVKESAKIVQLADLWTANGMGHRLSDAQKGLEFLAQQAQQGSEEADEIITSYLALREPWQRIIRKGGSNCKDYPDFMLNVLDGLQGLDAVLRERYLALAGFTINVDTEIGSRYACSAANAIKMFGIDSVELYAKTAFEWLEGQFADKKPHIPEYAGREAMLAMWNFLQEHNGSEPGAAKLAEHLAILAGVAPLIENHIYFTIVAEQLTRDINHPEGRAAVWLELGSIEVRMKSEAYDSHDAYLLWNMLADISRHTSSKGIFTNYVKTVLDSLDRTNGKAEGATVQLLDTRNSATIAKNIDNDPFWQSLSDVVSEVRVGSPGAWLPDTSEAASSLLEAVKGTNFEAEKALLSASAADIARITGYGPALSVLDLGIGNGEKLAAMLSNWPNLRRINACVADKNFFIAFTGSEELIRTLNLSDGSLHYENRSVSLLGKERTQEDGTPLTLTSIVEYFEKLKQHPAYQQFATEHPDYLTTCMGTTLGNLEPATGMGLISALMNRYALIGLHLYDGNDSKLIQDYDTPQNLAMAQQRLHNQGVRDEDFSRFEHVVELRKRRERINQTGMGVITRLHTCMVAKPGEPIQGMFRVFYGGDVINIGLSIKYTNEQAEMLFRGSGFDVAGSYHKGNVGLYLIEKQMAA